MYQQQQPTPQQEREQRRREALGLARANLKSIRRPADNNNTSVNDLSGGARNVNNGTSSTYSPVTAASAPSYRSQEIVERRRQMQDVAPANDMILAERYNRYESTLRPGVSSSTVPPRSVGGVKSGSFSAKGAAAGSPTNKSAGVGSFRKAAHDSQWNRSFNPVDVPCSKSPVTTVRIAKASKDTLLQLERNFNDLVAKRQHCDKSENICLKEYSILSHAVDEAESAITQLQESYDEHEFLVGGFRRLPETVMQSPVRTHESAVEKQKDRVDPHRHAFKVRKPGGAGGGMTTVHTDRSHYGHHAADSTTFVGLNDTNKALRHGETLLECIRILKGKIDGARQLLEDTAVASQKTQHLSQLIDTAMNVDLICMGRKADEGHIAVNAAPAFPHMKLDDFDTIIQRSASLTTYCTRVAEDLRKVVVNALAGHSEASKALVAAMRLGIKCANTKREEALRQADYLHTGKRKAIKDLDEALQEEAELEEQIARLSRIRSIRSTAASAAVFGGNGSADSDPVMHTLNIQMAELETRLCNEVLMRKERLGNEVRDFEAGIDDALNVAESNTADEDVIRAVEDATARWL